MKNFKRLSIGWSTDLIEITEDMFGDCSFEWIQLLENQKLTKIHPKAFTASSNVIDTFVADGNIALNQDSLLKGWFQYF